MSRSQLNAVWCAAFRPSFRLYTSAVCDHGTFSAGRVHGLCPVVEPLRALARLRATADSIADPRQCRSSNAAFHPAHQVAHVPLLLDVIPPSARHTRKGRGWPTWREEAVSRATLCARRAPAEPCCWPDTLLHPNLHSALLSRRPRRHDVLDHPNDLALCACVLLLPAHPHTGLHCMLYPPRRA